MSTDREAFVAGWCAALDALKAELAQSGEQTDWGAGYDTAMREVGDQVAALRPADQAYFWSPEWQEGEREADAALASGRFETARNPEELERILETEVEG